MAIPSPHRRMVGWYAPLRLFRTAREVAISTLFGRHADYRLIEALASAAIAVEDHSSVGPGEVFWLDYTADTGDGWNSTYAIAHAIAQPHLPVIGESSDAHSTQRGSVLIFGGDEVYPVASRLAYKRRLIAPYEAALRTTQDPNPSIYAVPGNHDWYDSLVAFSRLFGSSTHQWFAGWRTRQTRSYFALKLPRGWWLIGTDMQLDSDLDDPQVKFFKAVAEKMSDGDRIILCNAEPHWIYAQIYGKDDPAFSEKNLFFLENIVFRKKVAVFLAGDLHHYRRHEAADGTQKITAGGGGAFLHPTHGPDVSRLDTGDFRLQKSFPDIATSRRLCWRNLLFLFLNPWFGLLTATFYVMTAWSTHTNLGIYGYDRWQDALATAINVSLNTPVAAFWAVALFAGFWLFTDTHSASYRFLGGTLHGLAHLVAVFLIGWWATTLTSAMGLAFASTGQLLFSGFAIALAGWVVGSVIMGIYLLVSLNGFGRHTNEAFSALAIQDWKNFLRMKIEPDGTLTIYPIGIRRVPRRWKAAHPTPSSPSEFAPDDPRATAPELIEPPVRLRIKPGP